MKEIVILYEGNEGGKNHWIASEIESTLNGYDVTLLKYGQYSKFSEPDLIVCVIPCWNGSFPYTFKKMIDDSGWPSHFKNKSVLYIPTYGGKREESLENHVDDVFRKIEADYHRSIIYFDWLNYDEQNSELFNIILSEIIFKINR
jgi:hypothetical protein